MLLQQGDLIDIIAPASRCDVKVLHEVDGFLQSWGLRSHIPNDLFGDDLHCANSRTKRYDQLQYALTNPMSKAIWCLRGGYGSMQLLPESNMMSPLVQNKIFMGFSDITALHLFLQEKWGWITIHSPSLHQVVTGKVAAESVNYLKNILFKKEFICRYDQLVPLNQAALQTSQVNSVLTGGNLSLVQASIGTSWQVNSKHKILFLEETNEKPYRIDRMLEHLQQANLISTAQAILLGDFTLDKEPNGMPRLNKTLAHFANQCPLPVLQIQGIGHGEVNNPIILGKQVKLSLGAKPSLSFMF